MARTYRSESAANAALADQSRRMAQTREDWRAVLAKRDAKRAARSASMRRTARRDALGFAQLAYMAAIVGFSILTIAAGWSLARNALNIDHARPSCDSPIESAPDRAAVLAQVNCQ
jgi:hypothetical protein